MKKEGERYFIVGTKFRGDAALDMLKALPDGEPIELVREPSNPHDRNAVQVWARGMCIGYVRGTQSADLARLIDRNGLALDAAEPTARRIRNAVFARTDNSQIPVVLLTASPPAPRPTLT